jgi:quinolinate synthase
MDLIQEIEYLRKQRNAVVLAHNYQIGPVQDVADFVGDSLGLAQEAAKTSADLIVFCGVHFMAETAAILCPDKKILIPDLEAGCSLADSITGDQLREWKVEHPDAVVVSYVNTSADVKAESDYCCTSSNAVRVVQSIPEDREILFLPDMFLGTYVRRVTGRENIRVWWGECHVHAAIRPEMIADVRHKHSEAEFLIHPECGCVSSAMYLNAEKHPATQNAKILSTGGMVNHVKNSDKNEFVIATETGILHKLRKQNPTKSFYPVSEDSVCRFMKMITLEKLYRSLKDDVFEVRVPEEVATRAVIPIERMLAIV